MFNTFSRNQHQLVDAATLQQILDQVLAPSLERMGLTKQSKYVWCETTKKEIRRGFSYSPLKGAQGTFVWGVSLDFVPLISNGKVTYHKSTKNYHHHIFEWTDEYSSSFSGGQLSGGVTTHFGQGEAKRSVTDLIKRYEPKISKWFNVATSIERLIAITEQQIQIGNHYDIHYPNPKYVLPFLYAKTTQLDKATTLFDSLSNDVFDNNEALRVELRGRLVDTSAPST